LLERVPEVADDLRLWVGGSIRAVGKL